MHRRPTVLFIIFFIGFLLLIDFYVFSGVKTLTRNARQRTKKIIHRVYWAISLSMYAGLLFGVLFLSFAKGIPHPFMYFIAWWLLFLLPKIFFTLFLLAEDIYRGFRALVVLSRNKFTKKQPIPVSESRRRFVSLMALGAASIPFAGMLHGLTFGKFNYRLLRETLTFPDLPEAFDGFTITQVSDIHVGSFDPVGDRQEIIHAVQMAQSLKSDLFVFTGDLVNNMSAEMDPWMDVFNKFRAPYGQFSILGNHDYGMYIDWPEEERLASMKRLGEIEKELGFDLLRNENRVIEKDGQQLYILGVEDWGKGFLDYGDLDKALVGVPKDAFKILLSHDPSHFDHIVSQHETHVNLTLSGHTHGGQMGVEIPWLKWSPVRIAYPHWAGMYEENKRHIYVNRGFGFLALPARIGIWPEITVITLKKSRV